MRESTGDIFEKKPSSAIVITTNGYVKFSGHAVMGKGCARQASSLYPMLSFQLGQKIQKEGNRVHQFNMPDDKILVSFPVKSMSETCEIGKANIVQHQRHRMAIGGLIPGWACIARLEIIERSAHELVQLTNEQGWEDVIVPRPGCGAGELKWSDVKPVLEEILDDRFIVMTFK